MVSFFQLPHEFDALIKANKRCKVKKKIAPFSLFLIRRRRHKHISIKNNELCFFFYTSKSLSLVCIVRYFVSPDEADFHFPQEKCAYNVRRFHQKHDPEQ